MRKSPPVLIIAGPTASGKSALAMDVADEFQGTVINADSMQVYKELRLLTARPSAADEARVPHRLFGFLPASEACSVGRWLNRAVAEIGTCHRQGRLPVVVGGSGLYLKALTEGLAPIPDVAPQVRRQVADLHDRLGGEDFRSRLARVDPSSAARIPAGDSQRLTRALEVFRATGRPLSRWQEEQPPGPPLEARFISVALNPGRQELYAAVDRRFDAMMAAGALEEVGALVGLGLDSGLPAMKALGVKELSRHLRGQISRESAVEAAKQGTRNFVKRQNTWLRGQFAASKTISAQYSESLRPEIFSFIRQMVLTGKT